jgi:hypothetical protein
MTLEPLVIAQQELQAGGDMRKRQVSGWSAQEAVGRRTNACFLDLPMATPLSLCIYERPKHLRPASEAELLP